MGRRTSEDARRETLELLRSRPRSADTPTLKAHLDFCSEDLDDGARNFVDLARRLVGTSRYVEEWRQVRTAAEHRANTGLNIITDSEEFLSFLQKVNDSQDFFLIDTTGFSSAIPREDPRYYTASLGYSGGLLHGANNQLNFSGSNYAEPFEHTLTFKEWVNVITEIVAWRTPLFVAVGSRNYPIHDAVFDHRAWPGWMAWFPTRIDAHGLPAYALTVDIGEGTLVATQETNVITRDPSQVERAKEVEIALVEMGVLPKKEDLIGRAI
ncbi:immunity 52 family protein [Epibacterium sp. DP7N7-1]|nr:immunity 52 family protein [Epibacterium sp. DP7N7-1]